MLASLNVLKSVVVSGIDIWRLLCVSNFALAMCVSATFFQNNTMLCYSIVLFWKRQLIVKYSSIVNSLPKVWCCAVKG